MRCKYCGEPTGLFSSQHKECHARHESSIQQLSAQFVDYLNKEGMIYDTFVELTKGICSDGYIKKSELDNTIITSIKCQLQKGFRPWNKILSFIDSTPQGIRSEIIDDSENSAFSSFWKGIITETLDDCFDGPCGLYDDIKAALKDDYVDKAIVDVHFDKRIAEYVKKKMDKDYRPYEFMISFISSLPQQIRNEIYESESYKEYLIRLLDETFSSPNTVVISDEDAVITVEQKSVLSCVRMSPSTTVKESIDNHLLSYVEKKIDDALSDGLIDHDEESYLIKMTQEFDLYDTSLLQNSSHYQRMIKALLLRDIYEGKPLTRVTFNNVPIVLGKTEQLVWVEPLARAFVEKTKRTYVGKSSGVSVRVCKGVYYRMGVSKGYPIDQQYQSPLGLGFLFITTKNLIFYGEKSIKIPINKIISYTEYSDGIGLVKDGANPQTYSLIGCDVWFVINAIQSLA